MSKTSPEPILVVWVEGGGAMVESFISREDYMKREDLVLRPYAMRSSQSKGRRYPETPDPWRNDFQRDRDRVLHCTAFRRLESKTQVFVSRTGDHYRTRLTHTLEVAQISRSIARILGLNEDLSEAVALAHDLGHTPFGHSGGDVLATLMKDFGGFEHNAQSLRIIEYLEQRYPDFPGLNLSYEVRESIVKHKRPFEGSAYEDYHPNEGALLEAQLVDICDGIAYNSHDLDDGLASGILQPEMVEGLGIWQRVGEDVDRRYHGVSGKMRRLKCVSEIINYLLNDLIRESARQLQTLAIEDLEDVRAQQAPILRFSPEAATLDQELRAFLYDSFYTHFQVRRMRNRSRLFIEGLFQAFVEGPYLMPKKFKARAETEGLHRTVADYIAGMTDPYAEKEYRRLFDPFEESL
ncbi:MAG: deoxyguanosinetriphosphate triphosphohydrolase [Planctomycetota bacterium]